MRRLQPDLAWLAEKGLGASMAHTFDAVGSCQPEAGRHKRKAAEWAEEPLKLLLKQEGGFVVRSPPTRMGRGLDIQVVQQQRNRGSNCLVEDWRAAK